jgi:aldehyde dehydrogenase (NAD+)
MSDSAVTERPQLFIDGSWRDAHGCSVAVVDSATEEALGSAALADQSDVDAAVLAARRALTGPWGTYSPPERAEILNAMASALKSRAPETAELVSRENGMPIALSLAANGYSPVAIFRYYANLIADRPESDLRVGKAGRRTLVQLRPVGTVAAITPWNYPQGLAAMKLAPALAAGCSVVLKAPPETALDAYTFAEAALQAGLPDGVLNIVPAGREVGAYLVGHPGVDKVAFTGSTAAGQEIGAVCGRLLRPVTLELGGKSAAILSEDVDIDVFTRNLLAVSLPNNGQTCHASTRILAPQSRYGAIVDAVSDRVRELNIGHPLDRSTDIGPLVSSEHRDRVLAHIDSGQRGGARLTTGGRIPPTRDAGWFVEPTVFADVDNSAAIAREEIFGPVLCITPYRDIDDAIALANDSRYGLAATVWTPDESLGIELAGKIHSGTVGVNYYELDASAPFGGVKNSGIGRELGPEGLHAYLQSQSVYLPPTDR